MATAGRERGKAFQKFRKQMIRAWLRANPGSMIPCHLCGEGINHHMTTGPETLELDHIIPISKGGREMVASNAAPAHKRCNRLRGDRDLDEVIGTEELQRHFIVKSKGNAAAFNARAEAERETAKELGIPEWKLVNPPKPQKGKPKKQYQRGVDYGPYSPLDGHLRPEVSTILPRYAFLEPRFDEYTGKRIPGIKRYRANGEVDYGL